MHDFPEMFEGLPGIPEKVKERARLKKIKRESPAKRLIPEASLPFIPASSRGEGRNTTSRRTARPPSASSSRSKLSNRSPASDGVSPTQIENEEEDIPLAQSQSYRRKEKPRSERSGSSKNDEDYRRDRERERQRRRLGTDTDRSTPDKEREGTDERRQQRRRKEPKSRSKSRSPEPQRRRKDDGNPSNGSSSSRREGEKDSSSRYRKDRDRDKDRDRERERERERDSDRRSDRRKARDRATEKERKKMPSKPLVDIGQVKNCKSCGCSELRVHPQKPKLCVNCYHVHDEERADEVDGLGWGNVDYEKAPYMKGST